MTVMVCPLEVDRLTVKTALTVPLSPSVTVISLMDRLGSGVGVAVLVGVAVGVAVPVGVAVAVGFGPGVVPGVGGLGVFEGALVGVKGRVVGGMSGVAGVLLGAGSEVEVVVGKVVIVGSVVGGAVGVNGDPVAVGGSKVGLGVRDCEVGVALGVGVRVETIWAAWVEVGVGVAAAITTSG